MSTTPVGQSGKESLRDGKGAKPIIKDADMLACEILGQDKTVMILLDKLKTQVSSLRTMMNLPEITELIS